MENNSKSRKIYIWAQRQVALTNIKEIPAFSKGEVWWTVIGENVGIEINGKSSIYTRPVLILYKYSDQGFFGIPLTSQRHGGRWYYRFNFQEEISYAALSQGRAMSALRLSERIGSIPDAVLRRIKKAFILSIE